METDAEHLKIFVASTRARNISRIKSALLFAILLMLLWWQTRWPSLHLGLTILLLAQLGSALLLLYRNTRLTRLESISSEWVTAEEVFETRLHVFENAARAAGFLGLGWGFWQATQNLTVAILLGIVYPLFMYFGVARKSFQKNLARLRSTDPRT